jgi:hypothetical protein
MDASQYLRRLKESCTQTLGRPKAIDASLRTQIVRNAATSTYISPNQSKVQTGLRPTNVCCLQPQAGYDGAVTPIALPAGCISQSACNDLENRYAEPITIPGCPIPYPYNKSSTYVQADSYKYQGTREQKSEAERLRNCKDCTKPPAPPTQVCLTFNRGVLRTPVVNGFSVGSGAFTVEWFQKLVPKTDFPIYTDSSGSIIYKPYYYTIFAIGDRDNKTEAMSFYYQVSPPNPVSIYSVYMTRGSGGDPFYFGNFGTDGPNDVAPFTDLIDRWIHVAIVGDGASPTNLLTMFVNGEKFCPVVPLTNYNFTISGQPYLTIGGQSPVNADYYYNGCISNFRFTHGEALYTDPFTPPTTTLTARPSTQLLLKTLSDAPGNDSSTPTKPITPIGPVSFAADSPFDSMV